MKILTKIIQQMQRKTKEDLKSHLSQVQNEVYINATKSEMITQIRLNIIVECEKVGKEGQGDN